ncbi:CDP-6-deoxy-delta-3,4-glucoseen reductase [Pseudomethylobacillus aquaticus]|uniref:CDP-6-deoxy-delta-3,4-glucoseen reductase n=1 Tax=Pseudomethylobacillus aquaticus TaxID=2676064 RepID=A0A3N0V2C9_9PROT|nr:CDP-6-deoxy-delta-3,4-glucoseen reductase [Pseudomethylobacillus aquaticus]ROH86865.1 CDP-6-deoxy-delta-3,4-glucoseen reductase [Pseudomethylobacillus aquaticus]
MSYQVTIQPSGHSFTVASGETVLSAAIEAGINLPYGCRNGACGACKGQVLSGEVLCEQHQYGAISAEEKLDGKTLFCCALPQSDLVIECREISDSKSVRPRIMPARVQRMEKLSHDVMKLSLKLPSNERMQFMAGQYVEFLLKDGKRRAFSLANAPHDDALLELHLRLVQGGQFTQYVFNEMQEKAILRIEGPFGSFYLREESDKPMLMVAGGTGFAPIKGIIEHALHHQTGRRILLYWGARTREDLYMHDLPQRWQEAHPNLTYIPVLSDPLPQDGWDGRTGLVHQAVLADHADLSAYEVYCCGAPGMVEAAHAEFSAQGLPEGAFYSDAFTFATPVPAK